MTPFIGMIQIFGFEWPPRGWARCDGAILAINNYTALFSLIGTIYGGDGRTTFKLPDLRGRVPVHSGSGPGLTTRSIGQQGGAETTTLNQNNLPSHSHTAVVGGDVKMPVSEGDPNTDAIAGAFLTNQSTDFYHDTASTGEFAGALVNQITVTLQNTGNNTAFNNMQPYLVMNYCIALEGIFPSRN
jgi:microcystin-dependent protein